MTTEELLRPRYKVIADYPNSPHKIYEILESINVDGRYLNKNIGLWEKDLEKFPAIFKPLEWWEDRKAEDMPEYLKHKLKDSPTTYHKIIKWNMVQMVGYENEKSGCNILVWNKEYTYQPSTLEEYTLYINSIIK